MSSLERALVRSESSDQSGAYAGARVSEIPVGAMSCPKDHAEVVPAPASDHGIGAIGVLTLSPDLNVSVQIVEFMTVDLIRIFQSHCMRRTLGVLREPGIAPQLDF